MLSVSLNKSFFLPSFFELSLAPMAQLLSHRLTFYLTTQSTHFILQLYGIRHMGKDHSDSEKGNPLPPHRLLFPISSKGSFIFTFHRQDSTYHSLCYTSRGALAGTRNSSMGPPHDVSSRVFSLTCHWPQWRSG